MNFHSLFNLSDKLVEIFNNGYTQHQKPIKFIVTIIILHRFFKELLREYNNKRYTQFLQKKKDQFFENYNQARKNFLEENKARFDQQREEFIIKQTVAELRNNLLKEKITSEEVTFYYLYRVAQIGIDQNFIADVNFERAMNQARDRDAKIQEMLRNNIPEEKIPLLLGIPIAIKDHVPVKGLKCTMGVTNRLLLDREDCSYVKSLRNEGAVFLCMTTTPQLCMHVNTESNLWGVAQNPWNQKFCVGGSSGGCAGSIAVRCAPLSIGSDMLGSIRFPSAWNGVYGFKPTCSRISKRGTITLESGADDNVHKSVPVVLGPIGKCTLDMVMVCQSTFGRSYDDPMHNGEPFHMSKYLQFCDKVKPTLGIVYDDQNFPFVPACRNVVKEVAQSLEQKGFKVVQFPFGKFWEIHGLINEMLIGGFISEDAVQQTKGEDCQYFVNNIRMMNLIPNPVKTVIAQILEMTGNYELAKTLRNKNLTPGQLNQVYARVETACYQFFDQWNQLGIEGLVMPINSYSTPRLEQDKILGVPNHNGITNLLNLPAGTIPIRLIKPEEEINTPEQVRQFIGGRNNQFILQLIAETARESKNMPIAVQCLTLPNRDQECLKLMSIIEDIFKFNQYAI